MTAKRFAKVVIYAVMAAAALEIVVSDEGPLAAAENSLLTSAYGK